MIGFVVAKLFCFSIHEKYDFYQNIVRQFSIVIFKIYCEDIYLYYTCTLRILHVYA
jgi:hypothetical protein